MSAIVLAPGRERSVLRRHPWLFSGAIARVEGKPAKGETVLVRSHSGDVLGRAAYTPSSQIRARMWTYDEDTPVDAALITAHLDAAIARRRALVLDDETNCARLCFAESDGIPGLIVDQYDDTLVVQLLTAGADAHRDIIVSALQELVRPARIYERSDSDVRKLEGLEPRTGPLAGAPLTGPVRVREHGMRFLVDVEKGHKTGFYLDQRDSRARVRAMARGRRVLNCFSYTGGFAIAALAGGAAHVTSVDTSQPSLDLGLENARHNDFADDRHTWTRGDCFDVVRALQAQGEEFDAIVLDPPKFAASAAHVDKAARGYKDLNLQALKLLREGGLLFTFSCSGAIDRDLFQKIVAGAALETVRPAQILGELGHPPDHPVGLPFPEGFYLKGLIVGT